MELQVARQIIDTLAQGIHPVTGEAMPQDSPYNAPPVIRALHVATRALEQFPGEPATAPAPMATPVSAPAKRPRAPANAGKPWAAEDDERLQAQFDAGLDVKQLAELLGRTRFGVEQRLIKLGRIAAPAGGGRFGAGVHAAA